MTESGATIDEAKAGLPAWWHAIRQITEPLSVQDDDAIQAGSFVASPGPLSHSFDDSFVDEDARVKRLQRHIYARHYALLVPSSADRPSWRPEDADVHQSGHWRVIETLRNGAVVALRSQRVRRLEAGEYVYDGVPAPVRRGTRVTRYRVRCSSQLDPGFYYLFASTEADVFSEESLARYYLNVSHDTVEIAVKRLLRSLDDCAIPYFLKYPDSEAALSRCDALVIYSGARYAAQLHWLFAHQLLPEVADTLQSPTPLWALRLAPGLAFAQEPDNGESFGTSRSRALARGLIAAAHKVQEPVLSHVHRAFKEDGIDWDHPHLNADPLDRFGLKGLTFGNSDAGGQR